MRARWASTTSTEEIAPERMAAAVCSAVHCHTGPLGGRALAGLGKTVFFAFATARLVAFLAVFFAAFAALFFFLLTVFFAISRPVVVAGTLKTPGPRVETGGVFCGCRQGCCQQSSAPDLWSTSSITPELSDWFAGFTEARFLAALPWERRAWGGRRPYRKPRKWHPGPRKQRGLAELRIDCSSVCRTGCATNSLKQRPQTGARSATRSLTGSRNRWSATKCKGYPTVSRRRATAS